ncbi:hypothetical protein BDQ17DRAFT_1346330 [Cyathus striatus]|nr:hypothetical protein BDQ17DRAFT_1346330 [Cyathus striatus]
MVFYLYYIFYTILHFLYQVYHHTALLILYYTSNLIIQITSQSYPFVLFTLCQCLPYDFCSFLCSSHHILYMTDTLSVPSSSSSRSRPSTPPSPNTARHRPPSLRLNHIGIDPSEIVGKVLKRARISSIHPVVTLDFADNTSVQVLVDGYDPQHPGVPKELEMDPYFHEILSDGKTVNLEVLDCALVTLSDKAFHRVDSKAPTEVNWDQKHLAIAFRFGEPSPRWHCVWAKMQEYDERLGVCTFRSYDDVYLQNLRRSSKHTRRASTRIDSAAT